MRAEHVEVWGSLSHALGGRPRGRAEEEGKDKEWRPTRSNVLATIDFAVATGRLVSKQRRHREKSVLQRPTLTKQLPTLQNSDLPTLKTAAPRKTLVVDVGTRCWKRGRLSDAWRPKKSILRMRKARNGFKTPFFVRI